MNGTIKKQNDIYEGLIVLGLAWLITGLFLYSSISGFWTLGFFFLLIGLIGKFGKKEIYPRKK